MSFWWPRFARLAQWFTSEDERLRLGVARSLIEQRGKIDFPFGDIAFTLSARADRIDLYERGTARIIDYKTGTLPGLEAVETGFKPQLTLEAAILARDGFGLGRPVETEDLVYIKLSGGEPPGEIRALTSFNVMDTAEKHLAEFKKLLADYLRPQQAYLPAFAMERERDRSDFDHLSRHDEWALAGEVKA
jgi:ATP-dependent helicase/nuclease subunit B